MSNKQMRQIFLDTETTGLSPEQGHRIIEIAAIETLNRRATGNHYHQYINPQREIDPAAQEVHGITLESLQDQPLFEAVANELVSFVSGSELIIHNAPFDVGFLNSELGRIGLQPVTKICDKITDTLKMAKDLRPGQRNNLDALCRNFGIDNSRRTLHGALLDAELLAEVYWAMTRGQDSLMIDLVQNHFESNVSLNVNYSGKTRVLEASKDELALHEAYLQSLNKSTILPW